MSDYISCPACHGSGLIPMADAARIMTHEQTEHDEQVARIRAGIEADAAERKVRAAAAYRQWQAELA